MTYWFGSREGLISALVDWMCDESERQARAIATPVQQQIAAGQTLDIDAIAAALSRGWTARPRTTSPAWSSSSRARGSRPRRAYDPGRPGLLGHVRRIAEGLGSEDPARDGRAMAVMLDGLLLDRLAHPPQGQDVVAASVRWLLLGVRAARPGGRVSQALT